MKIVIDEQGNVIDELKIRNEEIIESLKGVLQEFLEEKNMLLAMKKQPKLGYRFMKQIMLQLAQYPQMKPEDFVDLDYETVNHYYLKFSELIAYYNRYFEIVDNKNIFMRYMGIDIRQYEILEEHDDEKIQSVMRMVNGDYIGLGWVAGESGDADVKATTSRLRASGGAGHSVTTASEDKLLEKVEAPSENDLMRQLKSVLGGEQKRLK
jgi:hypothetical protein